MPHAKSMAVMIVALVAASAACAQDIETQPVAPPKTEPQPGYGFAPTVGALLRADADKALAEALGTRAPARNEPAASPPPAPVSAAIAPKPAPQERTILIGIYGSGSLQAWEAELIINNVPVVLSAGQQYQSWRVNSIDRNCVGLQSTVGKPARMLCGSRR